MWGHSTHTTMYLDFTSLDFLVLRDDFNFVRQCGVDKICHKEGKIVPNSGFEISQYFFACC